MDELTKCKAEFFDAQREVETLEARKRPYVERMRKLVERINKLEDDKRNEEASADAAAKSKRKRS